MPYALVVCAFVVCAQGGCSNGQVMQSAEEDNLCICALAISRADNSMGEQRPKKSSH